MKTTFFSIYFYLLLCASGVFAQNFTFKDEIKREYALAETLEQRINASPDGLREIKIKRMAHPLDYLKEWHFYFVPTPKAYKISLFFCKNNANARKYGKGVFDKEDKGVWVVKDRVLIAVSGKDKAEAEKILAYLSE
ncbi:MAG: hypothetical protein EAZ95_16350 [Bacteroidetes bacterium]|nr:MAG: hypothetical protein EAZ95_16350 [Bacteroidota bacterium]